MALNIECCYAEWRYAECHYAELSIESNISLNTLKRVRRDVYIYFDGAM